MTSSSRKLVAAFVAFSLAGICSAWAATMVQYGEASSEPAACQAAKDNAARLILQEFRVDHVDSFSQCNCAVSSDGDTWRCTVTATYTPKP